MSDDLLRDLAAEPYEPRGILNSEMALIIGTCRKQRIDVVFESGRARGHSTYLLNKYLYCIIQSYELRRDDDALYCENKLKGRGNIARGYGDSRILMPQLRDFYKEFWPRCRIAVLLDGPKGIAALDLLAECFAYPNVIVGFIHDMRALDHGEPSPYRIEAEKRFPGARFSDDPEYVALTKHLDEHIDESTGWKPYHARKHDKPESPFEPTGSYGPTVGVFFNRAGQAKVAADAA